MSVIDDVRREHARLTELIQNKINQPVPVDREAARSANRLIERLQADRTIVDARILELQDEGVRREADRAGSVRAGARVDSNGQPVAHVGGADVIYDRNGGHS